MQNIDTDLIISCILPTSAFRRPTAFQVEIATNLSVTLPSSISTHASTRVLIARNAKLLQFFLTKFLLVLDVL